jgi:hypothetical protein
MVRARPRNAPSAHARSATSGVGASRSRAAQHLRAGRGEIISLDRWLDHLERNVPVARKRLDPEGVHQMRVALERLRVWTKLAGENELGDELRWIRRRLATVRDLDVRLEDGPPPKIVA